jgi:hypothetical protein
VRLRGSESMWPRSGEPNRNRRAAFPIISAGLTASTAMRRADGVTVKPAKVDRMAERAIARHAQPVPEKVAEAVTWGADEHVLIGLAVGWWLLSRRAPAP